MIKFTTMKVSPNLKLSGSDQVETPAETREDQVVLVGLSQPPRRMSMAVVSAMIEKMIAEPTLH